MESEKINMECGAAIILDGTKYKIVKPKVFRICSMISILTVTIFILNVLALSSVAAPIASENSKDISESTLNERLDSINLFKEKIRRKRSVSHPWENPCGGSFIGSDTSGESISATKASFEILKDIIEAIKLELLYNEIDVSDIKDWFAHNTNYEFLPKVEAHSDVDLVSWHSHIQVYVAAIYFLKDKQEHVDHHHGRPRNGFSKELRQLSKNSQKLLCAIESAINTTVGKTNIKTYSKTEMDDILRKLQTGRGSSERVNEVDLKFVKVRYYKIMSNMVKPLNRWIHETNQSN